MKLIIQHNTNERLNRVHHIPADFPSPFTTFFIFQKKGRIFHPSCKVQYETLKRSIFSVKPTTTKPNPDISLSLDQFLNKAIEGNNYL